MADITMAPRFSPFAALALLLLFVHAGAARAADSCEQLAEQVRAGIDTAILSKEPEASIRLLRAQTETMLRTDCANNAGAAYIDLRLQELGAGLTQPVGVLSPAQQQAVAELAEKAHARFPASAPIATVLARALHTVDSARAATRLDPAYMPAYAALADALLAAGQPKAALIELLRIHNLSVLSDGYSLKARILLAQEDYPGAIRAANQALRQRKVMSLLEPDGGSALPVCQAQEILGLAYLHQRKYKSAAHALIAARAGSVRAEALLRKPPKGLKEALDALHYQGD